MNNSNVKEEKLIKLLETKGQHWFSEEVEMENKTSFLSWSECLDAMKESYNQAVIDCAGSVVVKPEYYHQEILRKKILNEKIR